MFQTEGKGRAISKKPSQYPPLAFHLIRLGQWLSSLIVALVLIFFVYHLHKEGYGTPWTFLLVCTTRSNTAPQIQASRDTNNPPPPPAPHSLHPHHRRPQRYHNHPLHPPPQPQNQPHNQRYPHHPLAPGPRPPNLEPHLDPRPQMHSLALAQPSRHNGMPSLQSPHILRRHGSRNDHLRTRA